MYQIHLRSQVSRLAVLAAHWQADLARPRAAAPRPRPASVRAGRGPTLRPCARCPARCLIRQRLTTRAIRATGSAGLPAHISPALLMVGLSNYGRLMETRPTARI